MDSEAQSEWEKQLGGSKMPKETKIDDSAAARKYTYVLQRDQNTPRERETALTRAKKYT